MSRSKLEMINRAHHAARGEVFPGDVEKRRAAADAEWVVFARAMIAGRAAHRSDARPALVQDAVEHAADCPGCAGDPDEHWHAFTADSVLHISACCDQAVELCKCEAVAAPAPMARPSGVYASRDDDDTRPISLAAILRKVGG